MGYAELDYMDQTLSIYKSDHTHFTDNYGNPSVKFNKTETISIPIKKEEPLGLEIDHFLTCILTNKTPLTCVNTGTIALKNVLLALS